MSTISAGYTGPVPIITTSAQPSREEGGPQALELSTGSVAVTIVNGETAPVTMLATNRVANTALSNSRENRSSWTRRTGELKLVCAVTVLVGPPIILGSVAAAFPVGSNEQVGCAIAGIVWTLFLIGTVVESCECRRRRY